MQKMNSTIMALAVVGTAAAVAYGCMKPAAKKQLKRDMQNAVEDMKNVKEEMSHVGEDVSEMARNLKNQM